MGKLKLGLIVLKTREIEKMLKFYKAIGLEWVEEKHGNGPTHYSTDLGETVLEIYPEERLSEKETVIRGNTVFSFSVDNLDDVLISLQEIGIETASPAKQSNWGRHVLVFDPDNRLIEFIEPNKP